MNVSAEARAEYDVLSRLDRLAGSVSAWLAGVGILILLLLAFMTISEVVLRALFGRPIPGTNEIIDSGMAIAIAATFAVGVSGNIHLSITFIQQNTPSPARQWMSVLGSAAMLTFFGVFAWECAKLGMVSSSRNQITSILSIPQAPIQFVVAGLLFFTAAVQAVKLLVNIRAATTASEATFEIRRFAPLLGTVAAGCAGMALFFAGAASGDTTSAILVSVVLCVALVLLAVPICAALAISGVVGVTWTLGLASSLAVFGSESYSYLSNSGLVVLPFFLLMGAFAGISGIAGDLYRLFFELLKPIKGGLAHATIVGCAGFGSLTGSSLATVATFAKIALPEMDKRDYKPWLSTGTIAAGGTLGALVPPSVPLIIYGILVEASIGKLLVASFVPAMVGVALYLVAIAIVVRVRKDAAPMTERIDWAAARSAAKGSWAALVLFGAIWGGIYFGFVTDSEAASVGATGTFLFAMLRGKLRRDTILDAMREVTLTLAMIFPLIFGAVILAFFVAFVQLPNIFANALLAAHLAPFTIVLLLVLSYVLMGMVMDSFAIMFITAPIYAFIIHQLGYDPIWWGIITVVCVEIGVISPPFGLNLFVMKSMAARVDLKTIYLGVIPFCIADLVKIALLLLLPWLVVY